MADQSVSQAVDDQSLNQVDLESTEVDTTTEVNEATSPDSIDQHDEGSKDSEVTVPAEVTETEKVNTREANKMSQIEREKTQLKRQLEDMASAISKDEDTYRKVLTNMGRSQEEADQVIANIKVQNPNLWQGGGNTAPTMEQLRAETTVIVQREFEMKEAVKQFHQKFPEMDPQNIKSKEDKSVKRAIAVAVEEMANDYIQQGVPLGQSFIKAYEQIRGVSAGDVNKIKEEAELEGLAQANLRNATSINPVPSQSLSSKSSISLTEEEIRMAKLAGLTPEQYAEGKQ